MDFILIVSLNSYCDLVKKNVKTEEELRVNATFFVRMYSILTNNGKPKTFRFK